MLLQFLKEIFILLKHNLIEVHKHHRLPVSMYALIVRTWICQLIKIGNEGKGLTSSVVDMMSFKSQEDSMMITWDNFRSKRINKKKRNFSMKIKRSLRLIRMPGKEKEELFSMNSNNKHKLRGKTRKWWSRKQLGDSKEFKISEILFKSKSNKKIRKSLESKWKIDTKNIQTMMTINIFSYLEERTKNTSKP